MKREILPNMPHNALRHHHGMPESYSYRGESSPEVLLCSACGAVYEGEKWQWKKAPVDTTLTRCPTCVRVYQKTPAGYLMLQGDFALDHRNEMLSLIHHIETREKAQDPLKRIMWIEYQEEGVTITTTDIPLTRMIGDAMQRAYKGELDFHFNEAEALLFLRWKR